jgi:hypothetical protein
VFTRNFSQVFDKSLPVYSSKDIPPGLRTRSQWKKKRRKVRKQQQPVAVLRWQESDVSVCERHECDGSVTTWKEPVLVNRQCGLFAEDQTDPYRATGRTLGTILFSQYFLRFTSGERYIWWVDEPLDGGKPRWLNCNGKLRDDQLKQHLAGREKYGVRGNKWTRFGVIDLDLHEGDQDIFLEQLRVLLAEFHGTDSWHFQVADENAGGVHLIQAFREQVLLDDYRDGLRKRLQALDGRHPDLACRARAAGMRSLADLEIYPNSTNGIRLPLCAGRTMLLDGPLELAYDKRLKRHVPDVLQYVLWLGREARRHIPADAVFDFVRARLRDPGPKQQAAEKKPKAPRPGSPGSLGSLGRMRGRYAQVLADFWSGRLQVPDTLNQGIRLLALPLPYYLPDEQAAVDLIERYIDELPDGSFSDRLSSGDREEISRIVRNTVKQVYNDNGGQPDPELSRKKLAATVRAWDKRGFNPTDKDTWDRSSPAQPSLLTPDFAWTPDEMQQLREIQAILHAPLQAASDAVKYFLRLVKAHKGEISVSLVKEILVSFGVKCGHNGKANKFLAMLRQWDWIRITARESWHRRATRRKGRARTYAIGSAMACQFVGAPAEQQEQEITSPDPAAPLLLPQQQEHTHVSIYYVPFGKNRPAKCSGPPHNLINNEHPRGPG